VGVFLTDAPHILERINDAIDAGDARAVQAAAHALKGAVSNFAAPSATRAAARLQQTGEGGDLGGARTAAEALKRELDLVRDALKMIVNQDT
jgi:two-component system sensor histidine kinase/response regulator